MCGPEYYELSNNVDSEGNILSFVRIDGDYLVLECDQVSDLSGEFTVFVSAKLQYYNVPDSEKLPVKLTVAERCASSGRNTFLADDGNGIPVAMHFTLLQLVFVVVAVLVIFGLGICVAYLLVGPRASHPPKQGQQQSLQAANQGKVDFQDT